MKQLSDRLDREEQILDDTSQFFLEIPLIVKRIVESHHKKKSFDFANLHGIPSQEGIIRIINQSRNIIFPRVFLL